MQRDEIDVFQPVLLRHWNIASIRDQLYRPGDAELVLGDCEIQSEVCQISRVVFEEDEALVELAVQRSEVIQITLLSKPL